VLCDAQFRPPPAPPASSTNSWVMSRRGMARHALHRHLVNGCSPLPETEAAEGCRKSREGRLYCVSPYAKFSQNRRLRTLNSGRVERGRLSQISRANANADWYTADFQRIRSARRDHASRPRVDPVTTTAIPPCGSQRGDQVRIRSGRIHACPIGWTSARRAAK
jgi:hypothetical protein